MLKRTDDPNVFEMFVSTHNGLLYDVNDLLSIIMFDTKYDRERDLHIKQFSVSPPLTTWCTTNISGFSFSAHMMSRLIFEKGVIKKVSEKEEYLASLMLEHNKEHINWDHVRSSQKKRGLENNNIITIDKRNEHADEADDLCVDCDHSVYHEHNDRFEKPTSDCEENAYDDIVEIRIPMIDNQEKVIYYCPKRW